MAKAVNWNDVSMLTLGMKNLGNQFNARWPNRDGTSDGAIGDYAHTQEHSGHNPDDTSKHNAEWDGDSDNTPEVRAIDVDNNLGGDVSMQQVINHMRSIPNLSSVIRYMIYNKKIYSAPDFEPRDYTGASPHTEHAHFSGAYTNTSDQNRTFDYRFDELGEDMPVTDADVTKIWSYLVERPDSTTNPKQKSSVATYIRYNDVVNNDAANKVITALTPALTAILGKVDLDPSEIEEIKAALVIPTAEENAQAVLDKLADSGMAVLATTLRNALSDEQLAELKAEL